MNDRFKANFGLHKMPAVLSWFRFKKEAGMAEQNNNQTNEKIVTALDIARMNSRNDDSLSFTSSGRLTREHSATNEFETRIVSDESGKVWLYPKGSSKAIDLTLSLSEKELTTIVDNLNSQAINEALSANQGRVLAQLIHYLADDMEGGRLQGISNSWKHLQSDFPDARPLDMAYVFEASDTPPEFSITGGSISGTWKFVAFDLPSGLEWIAIAGASEAPRDFNAEQIQNNEIADGAVTPVKLDRQYVVSSTAGGMLVYGRLNGNEVTYTVGQTPWGIPFLGADARLPIGNALMPDEAITLGQADGRYIGINVVQILTRAQWNALSQAQQNAIPLAVIRG